MPTSYSDQTVSAKESPAALPMTGQVALVTGAGSGIGRAITRQLAQRGAMVYGVGRTAEELEEVASHSPLICSVPANIPDTEVCRSLVTGLERLDILIHSAGIISIGGFDNLSAEDFDRLYCTNLRAPFILTKAALPLLRISRGQVVFINSTVGVTATAGTALYAATKHGLKALADSLREEVNADEVRVLSIFPGRTATPMQARSRRNRR